eukprot:CAMPEP_0172755244 /NCGR_PEP_ID=MMETSP1074-20121228/159495_1 /TAXON_ID=2916 /ORGANISM="Ceratium fusus, Strain PA161109" /LENGTH=97 /DNA_ID=CAMNT_0013588303 /DNA_START=99 /DNA_END=390 /DNA_ORIENTATION=+
MTLWTRGSSRNSSRRQAAGSSKQPVSLQSQAAMREWKLVILTPMFFTSSHDSQAKELPMLLERWCVLSKPSDLKRPDSAVAAQGLQTFGRAEGVEIS